LNDPGPDGRPTNMNEIIALHVLHVAAAVKITLK
jgi:hypothetical protein